MVYQLGEVIRQIRHSKRYTQKYVAGDEMQRTTYAKIEACKMQPTIGKFLHILEMLDITFEEFDYIRNMYTFTGKEEIIHDFFQISTNVEVARFTMLKEKCEHYLAYHFDSIVSDILAVSKALILILSENDYRQAFPLADKVWQRLSKLENWYSIELKLLNNILFLFPPSVSLSIAQRSLREIERLACVNDTNALKPAYLINMTLLLLNDGQFAEANTYAGQAIDACQALKRYDLISVAFMRKGIALINIGKKERGSFCLQKSLQICDALSLTQMKEAICKEISEKTDFVLTL